jgi:ketosteroid isomerase-like protein
MTTSRTEIVRRALDAWNERDLEGTRAHFADDLEWLTSGAFPDIDPVYLGREGFRRFWDQFHEAWEYVRMTSRTFWETGDNVVVTFRFQAKGHGSGVEVDLDRVSVLRFNEQDWIVRGATYASLEEALAGEDLSPHGLHADAATRRD